MSRNIIQIYKMTYFRMTIALLETIAVAVFVHLYSLLQANSLQYGHKIQMDILPLPAWFYARFAIWGYLLPLLIIRGFFFKKSSLESQGLKTEMLTKTVSLLALVWLLGCVLAWQLPLYYPIVVIK